MSFLEMHRGCGSLAGVPGLAPDVVPPDGISGRTGDREGVVSTNGRWRKVRCVSAVASDGSFSSWGHLSRTRGRMDPGPHSIGGILVVALMPDTVRATSLGR